MAENTKEKSWHDTEIEINREIALKSAIDAGDIALHKFYCKSVKNQIDQLITTASELRTELRIRRLKLDSNRQLEKNYKESIERANELEECKEKHIKVLQENHQHKLKAQEQLINKAKENLEKFDNKYKQAMKNYESLPLAKKRQQIRNKNLKIKIELDILYRENEEQKRQNKTIKKITERIEQIRIIKFAEQMVDYKKMENMRKQIAQLEREKQQQLKEAVKKQPIMQTIRASSEQQTAMSINSLNLPSLKRVSYGNNSSECTLQKYVQSQSSEPKSTSNNLKLPILPRLSLDHKKFMSSQENRPTFPKRYSELSEQPKKLTMDELNKSMEPPAKIIKTSHPNMSQNKENAMKETNILSIRQNQDAGNDSVLRPIQNLTVPIKSNVPIFQTQNYASYTKSDFITFRPNQNRANDTRTDSFSKSQRSFSNNKISNIAPHNQANIIGNKKSDMPISLKQDYASSTKIDTAIFRPTQNRANDTITDSLNQSLNNTKSSNFHSTQNQENIHLIQQSPKSTSNTKITNNSLRVSQEKIDTSIQENRNTEINKMPDNVMESLAETNNDDDNAQEQTEEMQNNQPTGENFVEPFPKKMPENVSSYFYNSDTITDDQNINQNEMNELSVDNKDGDHNTCKPLVIYSLSQDNIEVNDEMMQMSTDPQYYQGEPQDFDYQYYQNVEQGVLDENLPENTDIEPFSSVGEYASPPSYQSSVASANGEGASARAPTPAVAPTPAPAAGIFNIFGSKPSASTNSPFSFSFGGTQEKSGPESVFDFFKK